MNCAAFSFRPMPRAVLPATFERHTLLVICSFMLRENSFFRYIIVALRSSLSSSEPSYVYWVYLYVDDAIKFLSRSSVVTTLIVLKVLVTSSLAPSYL
jgi:hypothetical protein